jgi:dolichol-phosphate mannosyltransferase
VAVQEASPATRPLARVLALPNLRRTSPGDWAQLIRFCLVGTSGYLVNLAVFAVLVKVAGAHYVGAAIGAFCVAWTTNFLLNKHWTFRRHGLSTLQQGIRNLTVSLLALGFNLLLLHLLVSAGTAEIPAQAIAIVAVTPISFLLNRRWSFR